MDEFNINENYFKLYNSLLYEVFIVEPTDRSDFKKGQYAIIREKGNQLIFPLSSEYNIIPQVERYIKTFKEELNY